jgi:hypothetical protein
MHKKYSVLFCVFVSLPARPACWQAGSWLKTTQCLRGDKKSKCELLIIKGALIIFDGPKLLIMYVLSHVFPVNHRFCGVNGDGGGLLPNAKLPKNIPQQIICRYLSRNLPKMMQRPPNVHRYEVRGHSIRHSL